VQLSSCTFTWRIKMIKLYNGIYYTEEQLQERADKMKAQATRSDDIWLKRIWLDKASDLMREVARSKGA